MRCSPALAVVLCALAGSAACAQSASSPSTHTSRNLPSSLHFQYDAQRDSLTASGMQIKPSVKSNALAPTTGTVTVTINICAVSHFSRGTQFHCSLTLIGGILDLANGAVVGGIETANGVAIQAASGAAACTLVIPYSWMIPSDPAADSGLILAFGVAAVTDRGDNSVVERSTLQLDGIENLPVSGSVSNYTFGATL